MDSWKPLLTLLYWGCRFNIKHLCKSLDAGSNYLDLRDFVCLYDPLRHSVILLVQDGHGSQLFESISSNIIGAPLTSSILVVILWSAERLKKSMAEHVELAEFVSSLLPAILGLLVVLFQYYALTLIFNPVPSNIEVKTSPRTSASYVLNQEMKERHLQKNSAECDCEPKKKHSK